MKSFYQKFGAWGRFSHYWLALCSGGAVGLLLVGEARATIVYSGQKNIAISSNYEGVFINVTAPESSTSASGSWDLNPFFGGLGIANSPGFQPARSGIGNDAPILALALGMSVGSSLTHSSGWGGSGAEDASGHLGPGAGQFKAGQTGYLGFKLLSGDDVNYGWMRVNLTSNGETGSVLDWAYDNSGSQILTGAVAPLGAEPIVGLAGTEQTLSPSQAGTGLLIENGAKIIFNEDTSGSTYAGSIQGSGEIKISGAGGLGLSGGIAGTGSLSKDGTGTLTLSGSNSYNGGTTVSAGGLAINSANALGSGALTLAGGTTIDNTSGAAIALTTNNPVNVNGNLTFGGTNDLNLGSGAVTLPANSNPQFTLNGTSTLTIGGAISGASDLTKAGTGTMVLSGSNNFTGALTVSGGVVSLATKAAVAGTSGVNLGAGTGLTYTGGEATIDRNITVTEGTGTLRNTGGGTLNLSGNLSKNGSVLTLAGGSFNITGVISGASANSDFVVDAGTTVTLSNANTYNGPTFIRNTSTLNANVVGALPTTVFVDGVPTSTRSEVIMDDTGTGNSSLALAASQQIASLTGAASSGVSLAASTSLTMGDSTGTKTFAGVISGSGSLIKDGASTQVLTGANTYTGETTISAGTLEVSGASGALTATSAVNITGGTLLLSGSAANRISNAAPVSMGADTNSILQLSGAVTETLGALTLVGGAAARVIDFGATSGVLTFTSLTATPNLPLHIWNWSGTTITGGGTDRLIITSGTFGGFLTASNISFFSGSGTGLYSGTTMFASGGELVPVPEASTLLAVLGLIVPLAWRERRHWMRCREARGN
jgi:autotransporter-associated beta strand protein